MLRSAGFSQVEETDVTEEFLATNRAWYTMRERYAAELIEAEGEARFCERQSDNCAQLKCVEEGLLRRSLFIAIP
jgi:hypothetical protein